MTGPQLFGERYQLGETLGFGGMSEVHRGRDLRLGRDVAVKVLRADLARDPSFQNRFRREAQNAASLNHPAIVAVYDTGESKADPSEGGEKLNVPYIVMEFVDGETLRDMVKRDGALPPRRAMEIMADVCAALDFSHRHGIVHRDVKPANIMLTRGGAVKVMDFGIARALGDTASTQTATAAVIGTAQYLSPEQARGETVDARSDVYAAGCVLYELLTGTPPFVGDSPVAIAYQHVRQDAKPPSEVNQELPPALDAIVLKALNKNPLNRYQTSAEMRSDLVRALSGQAVHATPVMSDDERTELMRATPARTAAAGSLLAPPSRTAAVAEPIEDDSKRAKRIWGRVGVGALLLAVLAAATWVTISITKQPDQVAELPVPNVVGLTYDDAVAKLRESGFAADPTTLSAEVADDQIGKVQSQNPSAATIRPTTDLVKLTVGVSQSLVKVPNVIGKTQPEAQQILADAKLTPVFTTDVSAATDKDRAFKQDPADGTDVKPGTTVNVVIGTGVQMIAVPDPATLVGQPVDAVTATLKGIGFEVFPAATPSSAPLNQVISIAGANPGEQVQVGTIITVNYLRLHPVLRAEHRRIVAVVGQRCAGRSRLGRGQRDPGDAGVHVQPGAVQPGHDAGPGSGHRVRQERRGQGDHRGAAADHHPEHGRDDPGRRAGRLGQCRLHRKDRRHQHPGRSARPGRQGGRAGSGPRVLGSGEHDGDAEHRRRRSTNGPHVVDTGPLTAAPAAADLDTHAPAGQHPGSAQRALIHPTRCAIMVDPMSDQTPSPESGLPGDRADSTTTPSPWTPAPADRPVWTEPASRTAQPAGSPDEQGPVVAPIDPTAGADQLAESPMPELDDNDPLLDTAQTGRIAIGGIRPAPMPTVTPSPVAPAPMPSTGGGYRPVPMPIGTPAHSAAPRPAQQATYGAPTGVNQTWQYPATWGTSFPPPNGPTPPPAARTSGPERGRGKRTALVATTIALALVAGLGGGFIGAQLNNATTGSSATAAANALTQQTKNEQTSNSSGGSVESVASSVLPSVVSVVATSQSAAGEGSGVILTEDGYILTNNHVVEGATDLVVRFNDGATAAATVVGTDPTGDLAVIKADGVTGLTAATLGTSGDVQVGEQVVAIGSPLGLSATVTSGIVSALNRPVRTSSEEDQQQQAPTGTASTTTILNAIQTDAAINPGNSGGPLVNMQGQIIGINSAIASLSSGESQSGSIGVGFAIPIDTAARIADEIIATGKATHAVLGASVGDAGDNGVISTGAEVKAVTAGGAAEAAGLQVGDVVTRIDDVLVESADALVATVRSAAPNSEHTLTIIRDGSTETVNVTLGSTSE